MTTKKQSQDEIDIEIEYLRKRFNIYYNYMRMYYKQNQVISLSFLDDIRKMVYEYVERKKRKDLKEITKEINVLIREDLPKRNAMEVLRLFNTHLGEDIEAEEKKYLEKIEKIKKRGKIKTEAEYRLIETRLDELFLENPHSENWHEMDKLLGTFQL